MMILDDSVTGVDEGLTKSNSITLRTCLVACQIDPNMFGVVLGRSVWVQTKLLFPCPGPQRNHVRKEGFPTLVPWWRLLDEVREAHLRESLPCAIKLTVAIELPKVIELTPEGKDFSHESNHPKSGESQETDDESDANASARRETEATEKDCSHASNSVRQCRLRSRLGTEIAWKQRTVTVESQGW
jgi:hypothetical protein